MRNSRAKRTGAATSSCRRARARHLAHDIDPNLQDATLVVGTIDWILAEFVRLFHEVSADEAQRIISDLITKRVPAVQNIDGFLKIQNAKLEVSDRLLVLYERGSRRATRDELYEWVHPKMRRNLNRALARLEHDRALIHSVGNVFQITEAGMREVEDRRLHEWNEKPPRRGHSHLLPTSRRNRFQKLSHINSVPTFVTSSD
jgi:DNA-binding transcriptional regulator YbjK